MGAMGIIEKSVACHRAGASNIRRHFKLIDTVVLVLLCCNAAREIKKNRGRQHENANKRLADSHAEYYRERAASEKLAGDGAKASRNFSLQVRRKHRRKVMAARK